MSPTPYDIPPGTDVRSETEWEREGLNELASRLRAFVEMRAWNKFHSPKNLAMALSVEVSELVEHFQWLSGSESRDLPSEVLAQVADEIGDVQIYLVRLADELGIDPLDAAWKKLRKNEEKYPAELVRGSARKYDQY